MTSHQCPLLAESKTLTVALYWRQEPCVKQPAATPRRVGRPLKYSVQIPFGSQVEVGQRLVSTQSGRLPATYVISLKRVFDSHSANTIDSNG